MSKLLAIETSTEACSVAISIDGAVHEKFELAPRLHAERVLPMVSALLAERDIELSSLDAVAFGRGPGSFTSLRIGIGVVQGLAWGAGLPVIPVSSLAAVAQSAFEQAMDPDISQVFVALDARMQEVFTAIYERGENGLVSLISDEKVCSASDLLMPQASRVCAAGNGFSVYPELVRMGAEMAVCQTQCWPHASAVCRLAEVWLETRQAMPAALAQPVYIRDNVAVKSIDRPGSAGR